MSGGREWISVGRGFDGISNFAQRATRREQRGGGGSGRFLIFREVYFVSRTIHRGRYSGFRIQRGCPEENPSSARLILPARSICSDSEFRRRYTILSAPVAPLPRNPLRRAKIQSRSRGFPNGKSDSQCIGSQLSDIPNDLHSCEDHTDPYVANLSTTFERPCDIVHFKAADYRWSEMAPGPRQPSKITLRRPSYIPGKFTLGRRNNAYRNKAPVNSDLHGDFLIRSCECCPLLDYRAGSASAYKVS